jgi:proteasome lid subunit RPN8/RPN11
MRELSEAVAILIASSLLAEIEARAAASPGEEVCGLLLGDEARIESAPATVNVAARPRDSFEVDPAALFAALRAERAGGMRVIGHYHSHPGGSSRPSPRDLAAAEPGRLWLIIGQDPPRLWLATATGFIEQELCGD